MIAYLRGQLLDKGVDAVVIDVHGVGYRVTISQTTLASLPETGAQAQLRIHTHVREDALALFGFATPEEEELFHHLTSVSGVGPKLAMNILSGMPPQELAHAIANDEIARLTKISGVGRKTAERLVVELADKLKASPLLLKPGLRLASKPGASAGGSDDLVSALENLGYKRGDAERAASAARDAQPDADLGTHVRVALQMLLSKAV
jgi:Holliday junction DNA helicase RuvA